MSNRRRTADNERQTVGRADVVPLSKKSAIRRRRPTVDRPLCRLLTDGGPPKFATWGVAAVTHLASHKRTVGLQFRVSLQATE